MVCIASISLLAKRSPNDAVNAFKLKLINEVLQTGNEVLGDSYKPFTDFSLFDVDDLPSNSDVTVVLTQYIQEAEGYKANNIMYSDYKLVYKVNGSPSKVEATRPKQWGQENKLFK
jgi:chloramphenicol O-acetyltransferase